MARRKKGNPVHGWVILDKGAGMTSTYAVGAVKRLFNAQKAGHAGTLDPLATGILPIALGEATKTVSFAVDREKCYRFTVQWGAETDTDDSEGSVVATSPKRPSINAIEAILDDFTGEISQVPPAFSAIKVAGARAYDLARDGETFELDARLVFIEELSLTSAEGPEDALTHATFEARCSKGTYVRALARDMGRVLGCRGHVVALRRTQVGAFCEDMAVTLEELEAALGDDTETLVEATGQRPGALLPITVALDEVYQFTVTQGDAARLRCGQPLLLRGRDAPIVAGTACALYRGEPVAVGEISEGSLKPTRVFNLA
ncbi:MAG: tRNA pseudouridine synthase [Pseudomonadota bacterium]|jgi:tRNA pseudouridine55 synthase